MLIASIAAGCGCGLRLVVIILYNLSRSIFNVG